MSSIRRLLGCAILLAGTSSCMNPRIQAAIAQNLNDMSNELNAQRQDMALLQEQVDSLKLAMAHQDSVIKRLINITGLPPGNWELTSGTPGDASRRQLSDGRYLNEQRRSEHRLRPGNP